MSQMDHDLRLALAAEREPRLATVRRGLDELARIDGWLGASLPESLAEHLRAERARLAIEVTDALLAWRRTGGEIGLTEAVLPETVPALAAP